MKKDWLEKALKLDFDPDGAAKNRVWARVKTRRAGVVWRRALAWAACAAFVAGLGGVLLSRASLSAPETQMSEEECAELNSRYLLAAALARGEENCPCGAHWDSYDKQTVLHLRKELQSITGAVCTPREQEKLKQCNARYKPRLQTLSLCKTLC